MNEEFKEPIIGNRVIRTVEDPTLKSMPVIRSEADIVAELKGRATRALAELCLVMDDAARAGFRVQYAGVAVNAFLHHEVTDLHLVKRY